ncbi:hypothetical protein ABIE26_003942 [Pedobacter africanus]|uniref:Uncharacterized protein n=1 Tax=Pedobacter africanus TaxID=151894 RepID=A0ACC6L1J1_9SPHI|nr:hypothetical protein [Pedobacter africanus]MDR6785243.1 hypothetical protein [Pedobacter africanus]
MSNNKLLMMIYRMNDRQGCLMLQLQGKKPCKIIRILEPLYLVGWIKQLSVAIDTGADQDCTHQLKCEDGRERRLKCRFAKEIVALEFFFKQQLRFNWKGTAHEFRTAVDRMIAKLPRFF